MSLKHTIENDYKNALKSKDKNKISTYRLILSSIKDLDIVNRSGPNKKETDDEDIKKLLKKMVKQRAESIDIYKKNNRTDLLEVEQNEYDILTSFLISSSSVSFLLGPDLLTMSKSLTEDNINL